ncbi:MAG: hypothetical protein H7Y01_15085 [Ferruginibacter sp.]|nr:hypothetical protein [Chitinophagaceae bacterium]
MNKKKFLNLLCQSYLLEGLIKQTFFQKLSGNLTLTEPGKIIKQKLTSELNDLERTLPLLIERDKQEALEILKKIKGNIFLLANIPFEKWDAIDKELLAQINRKTKNEKENPGGCGGGGYAGCGTWNSYNEYSSSFDSGCGSKDGNSTSSGDSGCSSGDSGCSGCGGGGD